MMYELEDVLIEMNQQIMNIEDRNPETLSRLEAKKTFLIGILNQVEAEFDMLIVEYDKAGFMMHPDVLNTDLGEGTKEAYNKIMKQLFKH